ncbi:MAG: NAD-dependent epimerase/dehydratase family protein [Candidatus Methanofastidiosia archaeon]
MKKIGITGAGGYVGAMLCQKLKEDYELVLIDDLSNSQITEINDIKIKKQDVYDFDGLKELLDVDLVVHLAALSGVLECDENPTLAYKTNVIGTLNICEVCRERKIPLIFSSSVGVIGDPKQLPIKEDHPLNPLNLYGFTKKIAQENIISYSKDFPAYILIKTNIYGSYSVDGKKISKNSVINIFLDNAKERKPLMINKPGTQARDFIYISDVIEAYLLAIKKIEKEKNGTKLFCIGSGKSTSIVDVAEMIKGVALEKAFEVQVQMRENPRKRETLIEEFYVDISKAKEYLNFKPQHRLERDLREMFAD